DAARVQVVQLQDRRRQDLRLRRQDAALVPLMDYGKLANRVYDLAVAARPDQPDRAASLARTLSTREDFCEVFPRLMRTAMRPPAQRHKRELQYLWDCCKDGVGIIIPIALEVWPADAGDRDAADALAGLMQWLDTANPPGISRETRL